MYPKSHPSVNLQRVGAEMQEKNSNTFVFGVGLDNKGRQETDNPLKQRLKKGERGLSHGPAGPEHLNRRRSPLKTPTKENGKAQGLGSNGGHEAKKGTREAIDFYVNPNRADTSVFCVLQGERIRSSVSELAGDNGAKYRGVENGKPTMEGSNLGKVYQEPRDGVGDGEGDRQEDISKTSGGESGAASSNHLGVERDKARRRVGESEQGEPEESFSREGSSREEFDFGKGGCTVWDTFDPNDKGGGEGMDTECTNPVTPRIFKQ